MCDLHCTLKGVKIPSLVLLLSIKTKTRTNRTNKLS